MVDVGHDAVLCLRYEWRNNVAVFLHNFHPEGVSVRFTLAAPEGEPNRLVNLLSEDHSQGDAKGRYELTLEPYGYRWFRMGGLDYAYRRTELCDRDCLIIAHSDERDSGSRRASPARRARR